MDRAQKAAFVDALSASVKTATLVVVTQPSGLSAAESYDLRRRMRANSATFKVAKNRLAKLALKGTAFEGLSPLLRGTTALAYAEDPVAVAKAVTEFADKNEKLKVLGGALGGRTLDAAGVKALASLPSLDTLRGQIIGLLQAPAGKIVGVLQAPGGQLARVISAYAKKDETAQA